MSENILLTASAKEDLETLRTLVPGVETENLLETALAVTRSLFEKSSLGVQIRLSYPDGLEEELRFKVKKPIKKKIKKDGAV